MKTKILTGLLAVITLGALTACSSTPKADESLWKTIEDKGTITVATEGAYAPFSYHDESGKLVGYDVEVAEAVAEKLGVKIEFVETKWDGIIAGLDAKKYDIAANQVGITPEREKKYLFSTPYTYSYASIVVKKDNNDIQSFEDLKGKKSAQTTTSNWATVVEDYGATIVATEGFNQSLELVLQGRADATVNDSVTYLDYIKQHAGANVKVAAQSKEASESAFLLRKEGSQELQEKINRALKELAEEGKLKDISLKYFNEDISVAN